MGDQASLRRVLIVEDDEPTQRLLATLLRRADFETTVAENGELAIEALRDRSWAVIILDLMMPRVDGHGVLRYMAANAITIPVIVCTAAGPRATSEFDAKVVKAVLRKPFDIVDFVATVDTITTEKPAPPRVLVVDDDTDARHVMRAFLDPADIIEAATVEEALEVIITRRPDVVLLDLGLPDSSGEELLDQLRANEEIASIPVVVVTSRKLTPDEHAALLARCAGIIYKGDLSRATLTGVLHVVLRERS